MKLQTKRTITQIGFFSLFLLAPVLDLFRLDLDLGHFFFFGLDWTLGLDPFMHGEIEVGEVFLSILLRGFLPIFGTGLFFFWVSWRFGRLYCGWLCPHFSVVELINKLMLRAFARPSVWESRETPDIYGKPRKKQPLHLLTLAVVIPLSGFVWAFGLLNYLLPPAELYPNLLHLEFTRFQTIFLTAATVVFTLDFSLARHLFCRFGCAVGLFQSYVWMFNRRAMVVGFERERGSDCIGCATACNTVCPMRLRPRNLKRHMYACTQCHQCIDACDEVQADNPKGPLLRWVKDLEALDVSAPEPARGAEAEQRRRTQPSSMKDEALWKSS